MAVKRVTDHAGLEGPGRVAFNRIVRRSHSPNRIYVVLSPFRVRVRIDDDDDDGKKLKTKTTERDGEDGTGRSACA